MKVASYGYGNNNRYRLNIHLANDELVQLFKLFNITPSLDDMLYVTLRGDWYRGLILQPISSSDAQPRSKQPDRKVELYIDSKGIVCGFLSFPRSKVTRMPAERFSRKKCKVTYTSTGIRFEPRESVEKSDLILLNDSDSIFISAAQIAECRKANVTKVVLPTGAKIHF